MAQVFVYKTLEPSLVGDNAALIAAALFGMRGPSDGARRLTISPVSGCISYYDGDQLWKTRNPGALPLNTRAAQKLAETWMQTARSALTRSLRGRVAGLEKLLPPNPQHLDSVPVYDAGTRQLDHWLSRFGVSLPTGIPDAAHASAAVDCILEVRLATNPRFPAAFVSTFRPYQGIVVPSPQLRPPPAANAQLIYRMDGPSSPQRWISPYYLSAGDSGDGDPTLNAATDTHSPMAQIVQNQGRLPIQVSAVIDGIDGRSLTFAWGFWRIDQPGAFQPLRTSQPFFDIREPGVYNVVVDVGGRGADAGALIRAQGLIYAAPPKSSSYPVA